jgi:hypothetical protein
MWNPGLVSHRQVGSGGHAVAPPFVFGTGGVVTAADAALPLWWPCCLANEPSTLAESQRVGNIEGKNYLLFSPGRHCAILICPRHILTGSGPR